MDRTKLPSIAPALETVAAQIDTNPGGDIFGGWILAQMDLAGGVRAYAFAGNRVVTAGVTELSFFKAIFPGDTVRIYTEIARTGRTSIGINISVWVRRPENVDFDCAAVGLFTFVSVDADNVPMPLKTGQVAA